MANAVNIAVTGLNDAAQRVANAASNIVNASSTSPLTSPLTQNAKNSSGSAPQDTVAISGAGSNNTNLATNIVNIDVAQVSYAADATVLKTAEKTQQALLNIVA